MDNRNLVKFLKSNQVEASLVDHLKMVYRPLICPFDELLKLIEDDSRVFDIGCGAGQFCLLVAEYTRAKAIYGIEVSNHLVKNARNLLRKYSQKADIVFEQYDGVHLPGKIAAYNTVFIIDVLHHMPKKQHIELLKNLYEKMAPKSRLIFKDIDAASPLVYANKLHDLFFSSQIGQEMKMSEAQKILKKIGFRILSTSRKRMLYCPHYTMVLVK